MEEDGVWGEGGRGGRRNRSGVLTLNWGVKVQRQGRPRGKKGKRNDGGLAHEGRRAEE